MSEQQRGDHGTGGTSEDHERPQGPGTTHGDDSEASPGSDADRGGSPADETSPGSDGDGVEVGYTAPEDLEDGRKPGEPTD